MYYFGVLTVNWYQNTVVNNFLKGVKMHTKDEIIQRLNAYKKEGEEDGLDVYCVMLVGSQNYNLADDYSDIDAHIVFIPTLAQLRSNKSYEIVTDLGIITCHNIYTYSEILAKGNPRYIESITTEYYVGEREILEGYVMNPDAVKGMINQKVKNLTKVTESTRMWVEKIGYNPKDLHHIIRLLSVLDEMNPIYQFNGDIREYLMDVKRGEIVIPKEELLGKMTKATQLAQAMAEERRVDYRQKSVPYEQLDQIVQQRLTIKGQNGL